MWSGEHCLLTTTHMALWAKFANGWLEMLLILPATATRIPPTITHISRLVGFLQRRTNATALALATVFRGSC